MGPEAAINAVFYNQIQAIEDPDERERFVEDKRDGVRGRHRHPAPRLGAGRRRRDRAGHAARRAGAPVRALRGQGPRISRRAATPSRPSDGAASQTRVKRPQGCLFCRNSAGGRKIAGRWGIKESGRIADIRTHPARSRMLRIHRRRANSHFLIHAGRSSVTRKRPAGQDGAFSRLGPVQLVCYACDRRRSRARARRASTSRAARSERDVDLGGVALDRAHDGLADVLGR